MQRLVKTLFVLLFAALTAAVCTAEEQAVVSELKINVRGQPSLIGEVVTQLQRGEQVTVIEYVPAERPKAGEPTNWAKIKLPSNTPVWVYAPLVKDGAVGATRLNLRAGPGDNYSVIGRLNKGDKINAIRTMGDWIEVEAPAGAYAFVDAALIKAAGAGVPPPVAAVAPAPLAKAEPVKPAPAPATIIPAAPLVPAQPIASAPAQPAQDALIPPTQIQPAATASPVPAAPVAAAAVPAVAAPAAAAKTQVAANKRVVRREGIVRPTRSIQAPTWYELVHPETKKTIDYLYEDKMGVKLKQYKGQKVIVSGEEAIDPRWPNTPILQLETLDIAP